MKKVKYYPLVFALLTLVCSCNKKPSQPTKPNIIFILADDLGYGDLGCYGQQVIQTPHIDKMASEGMRFTNHYAGNTVCAPSRCALLTGKHMGHARIRNNRNNPLEAEDITVAELLKEKGYVNSIIGKWGLGELHEPGHPLKKGFDQFYGYLNQVRAHNSYPDWIWDNYDTVWLKNEVEYIQFSYAKGKGAVAHKKVTHTHDLFMQEAYNFIENNKDTNFFLYYSITLPHANNEAQHFNMIGMETPDLMGYDTATWPEAQKAHAAMISYLDKNVGDILNQLEKLKIAENTLVIFTSDNGTHKEGGAIPSFFNSSGGLRGYKRDLYEGGIRVPFIAWWPGTIDANSVNDHISAFYDFLPTACELAGINVPEQSDGISYLPAILGKPQPEHEYLYWEFLTNNVKQAARKGNWKAVRYNVLDTNQKVELYDLSKDMAEKHDISEDYPEVAAEMKEIINKAHKKASFERAQFPFEKEN